MTAVLQFLQSGSNYISDTNFYLGFLRGIAEDPLDTATNCLDAFGDYNIGFNYVINYTKDKTLYYSGRTEKGNGAGTDVGYYIEVITQYMDMPVLMTDLWNKCDIDYIFQKIGKAFSSLSGALDLITNFMFRFFSTDDVVLYTNLSQAVDDDKREDAGLYFG